MAAPTAIWRRCERQAADRGPLGLAGAQHAGSLFCASSAGTRSRGAGTAAPWRWPASDPEARADALVGLAADALGIGRLAAAATFVGARGLRAFLRPSLRVYCHLRVADRLAVRAGAGWLPSWRWPPATVRPPSRRAEEAVGGWRTRPWHRRSARHRVKSDVVLAAALCSAGRRTRPRRRAARARPTADRLGLIPLRWALACLLIDTGSVTVDGTGDARSHRSSGYLCRPGAARRGNVAFRLKRPVRP